MKNYVVVVNQLYTFRIEVQAIDESEAEGKAKDKLSQGKAELVDFNLDFAVVDMGEIN